MKKPFIYLKSNKDRFALVFMLLLCASVSMLFFMPDASIPVFSNGVTHNGISGLFDLVKGLV